MLWVTRTRPKIDRIACPWLILRFVDPEARFLFVAPEQVPEVARETGAVPFDVEGVELSHAGPLCSFDAFLEKYGLSDPHLLELARIVRGADTDRLDLAPEAPGLLAISLGLSRLFPDDQEQLRHGLLLEKIRQYGLQAIEILAGVDPVGHDLGAAAARARKRERSLGAADVRREKVTPPCGRAHANRTVCCCAGSSPRASGSATK